MKHILVVDDEKPISDIIVFNLKNEGYEVTTAFDGEEAIEQFEKVQPNLVILDLMLPKMDGLEVCREIRKTSAVPANPSAPTAQSSKKRRSSLSTTSSA